MFLKNLCIFLYCTHCGATKVNACRFCSTVSRRADKIEIDMLFDVMLQAPTIWRFCLTFIYCSSQWENETQCIYSKTCRKNQNISAKLAVIFTTFQDYLYKLSWKDSSGKTIYLLSFRDLSSNRLQEIEEGTFNGARKLIDV